MLILSASSPLRRGFAQAASSIARAGSDDDRSEGRTAYAEATTAWRDPSRGKRRVRGDDVPGTHVFRKSCSGRNVGQSGAACRMQQHVVARESAQMDPHGRRIELAVTIRSRLTSGGPCPVIAKAMRTAIVPMQGESAA